MGKFAAGLFIGLFVGLGGGVALAWLLLPRTAPAPIAAPIPAAQQERPGKKGPRKARPGGTLVAPPAAGDELITLGAADLRSTIEGDALTAAATAVDMSSASEPRDLTQDEIDGAFGRRADAMIRCITSARGGASVTGRVVAGVVVGADGRVTRTRVEAPAWLLRHGLYSCARGVLLSLRFPAAGKESVVTVPFDLSE